MGRGGEKRPRERAGDRLRDLDLAVSGRYWPRPHVGVLGFCVYFSPSLSPEDSGEARGRMSSTELKEKPLEERLSSALTKKDRSVQF